MRLAGAFLSVLLLASGCASGFRASVESRTFPATKAGSLEAIRLAQSQSSQHRLISVEYRPDQAAPHYFWEIGMWLINADPEEPCRNVTVKSCGAAKRIDDAYILEFSDTVVKAKTPSSVVRLQPGSDVFAAAREWKAEKDGRFLLLVRYAAAGSLRQKEETHGWMWRDLRAKTAIVQPSLLCVGDYPIDARSCQAYEDVRATDLITLERGRDGREMRVHQPVPPTFEGAAAALAQLNLRDGKQRHVRVEIPWRMNLITASEVFAGQFSGVTQLDDEKICGGLTRSLVDEHCYSFASVDRLIVTDWRPTAGEIADTLLGFPFRFVAAIPGT